ncbi:hypothetical protein B0T16DRAFT_38757 [Cercophora newfieldiana]|uniref:Uncharacterized protein n=1 Tax=Cercophora newfieldiana TaxID=92897 RepID=A0AA39YPV2_9PEZI|nr:hypothetical protein B0T16DRAFT_38757 [Cercophora newfieldiana]
MWGAGTPALHASMPALSFTLWTAGGKANSRAVSAVAGPGTSPQSAADDDRCGERLRSPVGRHPLGAVAPHWIGRLNQVTRGTEPLQPAAVSGLWWVKKSLSAGQGLFFCLEGGGFSASPRHWHRRRGRLLLIPLPVACFETTGPNGGGKEREAGKSRNWWGKNQMGGKEWVGPFFCFVLRWSRPLRPLATDRERCPGLPHSSPMSQAPYPF